VWKCVAYEINFFLFTWSKHYIAQIQRICSWKYIWSTNFAFIFTFPFTQSSLNCLKSSPSPFHHSLPSLWTFVYSESNSIYLGLFLGASTLLHFRLKVGLLWVYDIKEASFDGFPEVSLPWISNAMSSVILGLHQKENSKIIPPFSQRHLLCSFGN